MKSKDMIFLMNSFRSLIKLDVVQIDNCIFKLHYTFTVLILLIFSILLTSKQYFGEPIDCTGPEDTKTLIDTYCWMFGTFIIKDTLNDDVLPGLGVEAGKDLLFQKYYQWISIIFFFQAFSFYVPRYLWKNWEGGRMGMLVQNLGGPLVSPSWTLTNKLKLVSYIIGNRHIHNLYATKYIICETINFLNVVIQILLMDLLLTGQFSLYGLAIATKSDAMNRIFPKITKCNFRMYGPSGNIAKIDSLCVLPLNVLNEKIFVFLWFWFLLLTVLSFFNLLYRVLLIFVPKFRIFLLRSQVRYYSSKQAEFLISRLSYGDFFVLYHIGSNINPIIYRELIQGVHDTLTNKIVTKFNQEVEV